MTASSVLRRDFGRFNTTKFYQFLVHRINPVTSPKEETLDAKSALIHEVDLAGCACHPCDRPLDAYCQSLLGESFNSTRLPIDIGTNTRLI